MNNIPNQLVQASAQECLQYLVAFGFGSGGTPATSGAPSLIGANFALDTITTSTGSSAQLLAARPTRVRATIKNNDTANSVFISTTTATINSFPIKAGESITITSEQAINIIDNGSHASVSVWEEWN